MVDELRANVLRKSLVIALLMLPLVMFGLSPQPARGDVLHLDELHFPRTALINGACLEFDRVAYQIKRIAQFNLILGVGLYPEYWIEDPVRERILNKQLREVYLANDRIVMLGALNYPCKVFGMDPQAPAAMWLRDMDGKVIEGWPGMYYIDYSKPETIDFVAGRQTQLIKKYPQLKGLYLEDFSLKCPVPSSVKLDLNRDGSADSTEQLHAVWDQAGRAVIGKLRAAWGGDALLLVNCNESLPQDLRPLLNGIVYDGNYPPDIVSFILTSELEKWSALSSGFAEPTVHVIVENSDPALIAECADLPWQTLYYGRLQQLLVRAKHDLVRFRVGLAMSFFCGSFYAYQFSDHWPGQVWWFNELSSPLGLPLDQWEELESGVFKRAFQSGTIILNTSRKDYDCSLPVVHHDMAQHQESTWFVVKPGDLKILIRKVGETENFSFLELPREEISLYPKDATFPLRPMPPGVLAVQASSWRDGTREGVHHLIDGVLDDPSLFVSDIGMPQHAEVVFKDRTILNSVTVTPVIGGLKTLIYHYRIKVYRNGKWETIFEQKDNNENQTIQVKIDRDNCERLLFEVLKTADNRMYLREISWE